MNVREAMTLEQIRNGIVRLAMSKDGYLVDQDVQDELIRSGLMSSDIGITAHLFADVVMTRRANGEWAWQLSDDPSTSSTICGLQYIIIVANKSKLAEVDGAVYYDAESLVAALDKLQGELQ